MGMLLPPVLPEADRAALIARVNRATGTQRDVLRARIILTRQEHGVRATARLLSCAVSTVVKWCARYRDRGLAGLRDLPRAGARRVHGDEIRRQVATVATSDPPRPWTRWTPARVAEQVNALPEAGAGAAAAGGAGSPAPPVSRSWVRRVLRDAHIRVHRVRSWLHRKPDPHFAERIAAIEAAVAAARAGERTVICLDEKTAVGVRTPCHRDTRGPDGVRRREFEYRRAGTVAWYGTQEATTGTIALRRAHARMDSAAFTATLDDLVTAQGQELTIIMDNGPTHTSRHTTDWIGQHPGLQVLFTPVHASWANPEEVVLSILARQVIIGGRHSSGDDLDDAAQQWVQIRNQHPLAVRWSYQRRVPRTSEQEH
jgi:hypothetical protein